MKEQQYQAKFRADSGSNLHLQPYNRGYALSESGELIAIITYRKGAVRVAQLLAQAWPQRFGQKNQLRDTESGGFPYVSSVPFASFFQNRERNNHANSKEKTRRQSGK
jgi:hypothetical protein